MRGLDAWTLVDMGVDVCGSLIVGMPHQGLQYFHLYASLGGRGRHGMTQAV